MLLKGGIEDGLNLESWDVFTSPTKGITYKILQNFEIQYTLDLRKPDLRKNLDLRKIVATTDFLVQKLFDLRKKNSPMWGKITTFWQFLGLIMIFLIKKYMFTNFPVYGMKIAKRIIKIIRYQTFLFLQMFILQIYHLQGVSHWNVSFKMTLTDRNMEVRFRLNVTEYSWDLEIWVSSTSF